MTTDEHTKQINGPINAVRLEGTVAGINKVIYLFMDIHYAINEQTECDNIYAKDIHQYLASSFRRLNDGDRMYDFYLEIEMNALEKMKYGFSNSHPINFRVKYLAETRKFFNKIFIHEPSENKVYMSDKFKNVRFHYIDVREYFNKYHYDMLTDLLQGIEFMWKNMSFTEHNFRNIINVMNNFSKHCLLIRDILTGELKPKEVKKVPLIIYVDYESKEPPKPLTGEEEFERDVLYVSYLLNKMFNKYNHPDIQKKLSTYRKSIIEHMNSLVADCENMIKFCDDTNKLMNDIPYYAKRKTEILDNQYTYGYGPTHNEMTDIFNLLDTRSNTIFDKFIIYFMEFIDVYFLRRFLDKDYVTNAIVYTGSWHSCVYIDILTKKFDFKITHASYSSIDDMNELNKKVLEHAPLELSEFFYPPIRSQCSDMTHFPENFT